jgi:hypothetical protein
VTLNPVHVGCRRTFRRVIGGLPNRVDLLVRHDDGTVDPLETDLIGGAYEVTPDTFQIPGTCTLRWNAYENLADVLPRESHEEELEVLPTAFAEPFQELYGVVQMAQPYRKHTGYFVEFFNQHLDVEPETGDVLIQFVWNTSAAATTMTAGQGWTQQIKQLGAPNPFVRTEIWTKRWGDGGQVDATDWQVFNSAGLVIGWSVVVRGCAATGSYIDALAVTSSGSDIGPITYPAVTATGANRLVLRMCSTFPVGIQVQTHRHGDTSEGHIRAQANVYVDGEPAYFNPAICSVAETIKGAGSTGTATMTTDITGAYYWQVATIALLPRA